jgi:hypothetical protein
VVSNVPPYAKLAILCGVNFFRVFSLTGLYIYVKFFDLLNNKALLEYIPDDYFVSLWKQCGRREFTLIANIPST